MKRISFLIAALVIWALTGLLAVALVGAWDEEYAPEESGQPEIVRAV